MSGGYTPLFSSLTTGTLCGKWPDIGLWPIVLSLCDKNGVVDVTPMYISGITGLPVGDVIACMNRFCGPDPYSRTETAGGSRLALLDDHRDWGWRVINHLKYREKARKQAYDNDRTASGADAARKAAERSVPLCPAKSRALPLSDSDSDSNKEKDKGSFFDPSAITGLDVDAWHEWVEYREKRKPAIRPESRLKAAKALAKLGSVQRATVDHSIANGYQGLVEPRHSGKGGKVSEWE